MSELYINIDNDCTPKKVPQIVPLAYQAISMLEYKTKEIKKLMEIAPSNIHTSDEGIPIWERYSLSISEASQYFGIGEKRLYQIVSENQGAEFILEIGTHIRIKRELFARFLDRASCV